MIPDFMLQSQFSMFVKIGKHLYINFWMAHRYLSKLLITLLSDILKDTVFENSLTVRGEDGNAEKSEF